MGVQEFNVLADLVPFLFIVRLISQKLLETLQLGLGMALLLAQILEPWVLEALVD